MVGVDSGVAEGASSVNESTAVVASEREEEANADGWVKTGQLCSDGGWERLQMLTLSALLDRFSSDIVGGEAEESVNGKGDLVRDGPC